MTALLVDKDAIRELMAEYCFCCDTRDAEGLGALFTEDCIWDGADFGVMHGPEELKGFLMRETDGPNSSRHLTFNEVIDVNGDSATARCYFSVVMVGEGLPQIVFTGFYHDKFVRRNGRWLFQERVTKK